MPRFEHYPFRYRDARTGRWQRARYKADLQTIADRYAEFEITGPPDMIEVDTDAAYFNPLRRQARASDEPLANLGPIVSVRRPDARLSPRIAIVGEAVPVAGKIDVRGMQYGTARPR